MEHGQPCKCCDVWKIWSEFPTQKRNKSGHRTTCKTCWEIKTNVKKELEENKITRGLNIDLKFVPTERFWKGLDIILDIILYDMIAQAGGDLRKALLDVAKKRACKERQSVTDYSTLPVIHMKYGKKEGQRPLCI